MAFFMLTASNILGQGKLTGTITDANGETVPGVNVMEKGTTNGVITDNDGNFAIDVIKSKGSVVVSFVGFATKEISFNLANSKSLGSIKLEQEDIGIAEVSVIASMAQDRKTPVAVSTLSADEIETRVGNQEFPEIMKTTPSVYITKTGGGYGDARINVRGFDQRNVAVMINGIPVNDMENGWVYWSNWAGLSDVANNIQIQRGLGASKLAVPSVGGSINIITNAAKMRKGGSASASVGNDGYQKYGVVLSSGLLDNGWAITAQGTFAQGNGYIDGTAFRAWSYFLGISKVINDDHTISFTGIGAPQWHNQRSTSSYDPITLQTYEDLGIKYNYVWGEKDGEEYTWRKNFYHKPKFFLNHYWTMSDKTDLKTSAYASIGRGGGTGPRGRITGPSTRIYDSSNLLRGADGQVRWDDMVRYNSGQDINDADWGVKGADATGTYAGQYTATSRGQGFIRRASMNSHDWYGVLSTLTHKFNDKLTLTTGIDGRYYKGMHYRKLDDLLGNDAYLSTANDNNDENYITNPDASIEDGNVLNYNNDGLVRWLGLFGQIEYSTEKLTVFLSTSGSNQDFKRIDHFNYLDSDPEQTSEWQSFTGGNVKGGINYNINDKHNIFVNGGYISRQPVFDNVFINYVNDINNGAKNQTITAYEAGYGFRGASLIANLNVYRTLWDNRQFDRGYTYEYPETHTTYPGERVDATALFDNVGQLHQGVELELFYTPFEIITLKIMGSIGDWKYVGNFEAAATDTDNGVSIGTSTMYMEGLKVGDAAQTTFSFGVDLRPVKNLTIYASYSYYDELYANFDIDDNSFYAPNPEILQLPAYGLLDAGFSYKFELKKISLVFKANMNNVLDEKYVAELFTNDTDNFLDNQGYYGFGRTMNFGIKVLF